MPLCSGAFWNDHGEWHNASAELEAHRSPVGCWCSGGEVMAAIALAMPGRRIRRQNSVTGARLSALMLVSLMALGHPALSEPRRDCAAAEIAVRQHVMPLLLRTDPEVSAAVRSSITAARLARAHCISGRTERGLQLYERIVTELDPYIPGPDRDLADELWR